MCSYTKDVLTGIIIMPMVVAGGVGFILNGTELLIAGHIMDLINGEE